MNLRCATEVLIHLERISYAQVDKIIMSEYQYYEFQAIDRPLSEKEQAEVGSYSSRAEVTPTRAVFTYNFSDFPGDPIKILQKYFDAILYLTNWETNNSSFACRVHLSMPKRLEITYLNLKK